MDPHGEIETITNFLENSEAKLAFIGSEVVEKFSQIEEKLGRHIPASSGEQSEYVVRTVFSRSMIGRHRVSRKTYAKETPAAAGDDIALLMYTSGTTGTPKGVPLTHGNIVAELDGVNRRPQLSRQGKDPQPAAAFSRLSADRKSLGRDDLRLRSRLSEGTDAGRTRQSDEGIQADDPHDGSAALVSVSQKDLRRR